MIVDSGSLLMLSFPVYLLCSLTFQPAVKKPMIRFPTCGERLLGDFLLVLVQIEFRGSDETKKRCYVCTMASLAEFGHRYVGIFGKN